MKALTSSLFPFAVLPLVEVPTPGFARVGSSESLCESSSYATSPAVL